MPHPEDEPEGGALRTLLAWGAAQGDLAAIQAELDERRPREAT
jgi:hypothetical protein